ncbi:MAG: chorismate synthase [bacterium]
MPGNSYGSAFRVTTWGESHGDTVGVVVDGCPPQMELEREDVQKELDRRKPGQSKLTTQRKEGDWVRIMSGVFEGETIGTPISMMVENEDARAADYEDMKDVYRPSHADMTYDQKYGTRNWMGGGRSSARETVGRVAAGAIARKWLQREYSVEIVAWVRQVNTLELEEVDHESISRGDVESNEVRCPDSELAEKMSERIQQARSDGVSLGGVVEVVARNCPAGWGEPVFDKLDGKLGHHYMSIPATKGVEIGSGFRGITMNGAEHNDEFYMEGDEIKTRSNNSGGMLGGISNGMPITARIAFKPTSTINHEQDTVNDRGEEVKLSASGRHDPCVVPRAVPIVEACTAITLMDLALQDRGQNGPRGTDVTPIR